ncbi:hypothetical protein V2J09_011816 [Rumex salicifolius]
MLWLWKPRKEGQGKWVRSNQFIGSLLTPLAKELHSIEESLSTDGLVDMKLICGIIAAKKKGKLGKEGKVSHERIKQIQNYFVWKYVYIVCPFDCNFGCIVDFPLTLFLSCFFLILFFAMFTCIAWMLCYPSVYLGGYDMEEKAARAYDLAALKYWGPSTHINFPIENYKDELEEMKNMTRQEYVAHLRRKSSGFSRGASMYRGVTRHHQHGRWQARIGRVAGNKDLYLGTFSTQEEAAEAYDIAAIKFRGVNAVTNFDITRYDVDKIMTSNTLLAGEQAKRIKSLETNPNPIDQSSPPPRTNVDGNNNNNNNSCDWKMVLCDETTTFDENKQENNNVGVGNYQGSSFSAALQDLIGNNSLSSSGPIQSHHHHQSMVDESNKIGSIQFSNASSIVTSLNSSREGSPDKGVSPLNMMFPKAPVGWITPAQLRQLRPPTAIPMAHLPGYAAWNDA